MERSSKQLLFERMAYLNENFNYVEEDVREKTPIGKGKDHVVYDYEGDPNKVIKVAWGDTEGGMKYMPDAKLGQVDLDPKHVKMFNKYPDIFPKVHKFTNKYAIIDKLDTDKIKTDQQVLYDLIKQYDLGRFQYTNQHSIISQLYFVYTKDEEEFEEMVGDMTRDHINSPIFNKYIELFEKINSSLKHETPIYMYNMQSGLDMNDGNFGYDAEGKLKLIDF